MYGLWDGLRQDLRFGWRMLRSRPGVTAAAIIALALGIGANTAIFSVVNALLMRPLPFEDLDRIVAVWEKIPSQGVERNETAAANYFDWQAQQTVFESMGMYRWWSVNLTGVDVPERVQGFLVTASLFDVLGVDPAYGRRFQAEEEEPGRDGVVILNHGFWQRRFGGDPQILGRTIALDGAERTVIGIMPPEFNFPRGGEILAPLALTPAQKQNRGTHYLLTVARLKTGTTLAQAQAEVDAIARRIEQQNPNTNTGRGVALLPLLADTVHLYRPALLLLFGAVGFVLLIACANVANLCLARAAAREREIAIRSALGAGRWRIRRQLLTESVILALLGGAFGGLFAWWGVDLLRSAIPADFARFIIGWENIAVDLDVLGFALGVSLLTGMIFGLAPALGAAKPDLTLALKEGGGRTSAGPSRHRLRKLLVISEVALSLVLLAGAGLMLRSFVRLINTDPGFNSERVLTMELTLPRVKYRAAEPRVRFYEQLLARLHAVPEIEAAGIVNHMPLGGSNSSTSFLVEGLPEPPPGQEFDGRYRVCSPGYFRTLGMTLRSGRAFTEEDRVGSRLVVIVNEALAQRYWPNEDAIGKRIRFTGDPARNPWMEVVGVVGNVKHEMNLEVTPEYYLPYAQDPWSNMVLLTRTRVEPMAMAARVRGEVLAIDKDQPVAVVRTMDEVRGQSVFFQRFAGFALSIFALLALILAGVGIYGVMSYTVTQRSHEIGVRMALGARTGDVVRLIVRQGMGLVLWGVGIGIIGALGLTRLMSSMLYGTSATDPLTFAGVSLLLMGVAGLASYLPARRATRVDPMVALRCE